MKRLTLTGLLPGNEYAVQIKALNAETESGWSRKFVFVTSSDVVMPKTPANVTWLPGNDVFIAEWDAVTQNIDNTVASISKYEIELTNTLNSVKKVVSYDPPSETRHTWTIDPTRLKALFGTIIFSVGFRVRAVNFSGNVSAWSSYLTAVVGQPDPPTNAVVTSLPSALGISWTPPINMNNVSGYRVYVGNTAGTVSAIYSYEGQASTYTLFTAGSETKHFKIRSYSSFGPESTELLASGTSAVTVDNVAPGTPTALAGTVTTNSDGKGGVGNVTWTMNSPPTDLSGFNIRYRDAGAAAWQLTVVGDKDARSAQFIALAYKNYEGQIQAFDGVGNTSAWSATATFAGEVNIAPVGVTGLAIIGTPTPDSIQYSWTASTEADVKDYNGGYDLQVSTSNTFPATSATVTYRSGDPGMAVTGVLPNTIYYARVRAVDGLALAGPWSSTVTTTSGSYPVTPLTDGSAPTSSPTPTIIGGIGYLFASWIAITNNDIVTYEVHVSTTTGFTPAAGTKVGEVTGTSMVIESLNGGSALVYGTPYYVKLIAKDKDGVAAAGAQGTGSLTKGTIVDLILVPSDIGAYTQAETTSFISTARTGAVTDVKTLWGHPLNTTLIDGGDLYTNTVKASAIAIADFTNYIADGDLSDPNFINWSTSGNPVRVAAVTTTPPYLRWIAGSPGNAHIYNNHFFEVSPGDSFYFKCEVSTPASNTAAVNVFGAIMTKDAAGATVTWPQLGPASLAANTGWTVYEGTITVPAGTSVTAQFDPFSNSTVAGQEIRMRSMTLRRRNGGELIVDGSVAANKITAGSYTGGAFVLDTGGIIRTAGGEVVITSTGITVGPTASGGISTTKLTSGDITATNTITVLGTIKVGSSGWIESSDFASSGGATGYRLTNTSLTMKTGSVSVATLSTGIVGGGGAVGITLNGGSSIILNSGHIRGGGATATSYATAVSGNTGFYLGNDGLFIAGANAQINVASIQGGSYTGSTITLSGASSAITGPGFSLSSAGLSVTSGNVAAGTITTGTMTSSQTVNYTDVNGVTQTGAAWSVNLAGGATFNNVVVRGTIESANIVGTTQITGAKFLTASAGNPRMEINTTGNAHKIAMYSMVSGETTPASLYSTTEGTLGSVILNSPIVGGTEQTYIKLRSGSGNAGVAIYTGGGTLDIVGNGSGGHLSATGTVSAAIFRGVYRQSGGGAAELTISNTESTGRIFLNTSSASIAINGSAIGGSVAINSPAGTTITNGLTLSGGLDVTTSTVTFATIANGAASEVASASISNTAYGYVLAGQSGRIFRADFVPTPPSALKLKENINPISIMANQVLALEPLEYNFKDAPDKLRMGFIADYALELGLDNWVSFDEDGEVAGFDYSTFGVAQQVVLIDHDGRVESLEEEKAKLEDRVTTLESKITQLLLALDK